MSRQNNGVFGQAHWWKSSRSAGSNGGACVEFTDSALAEHDLVGVRDSKDRDNRGEVCGPVVAVSGGAWRAFSAGVRAGQFDL